MSKLLSIDQLLEAALESNMPGLVQFVEQAESLATNLGKNLAAHLGIESDDGVWQGEAFCGLCVRFGPAQAEQECPAVIESTEDGEWKPLEPPAFSKSMLRPNRIALPSDESRSQP